MAKRTAKLPDFGKKLPLVMVEWEDSASTDGWMPFDEAASEAHATVIFTVGWVAARAKGQINLVSTIQPSEEDGTPLRACLLMSIPMKCVKRIVNLRT